MFKGLRKLLSRKKFEDDPRLVWQASPRRQPADIRSVQFRRINVLFQNARHCSQADRNQQQTGDRVDYKIDSYRSLVQLWFPARLCLKINYRSEDIQTI